MENILNVLDLESIVIGLLTGAISSLAVTLWFNYKSNKKEEYEYLWDVCNFMHQIATLSYMELDKENKFWSIFYRRPTSVHPVKYYKKIENHVEVYYKLYQFIECEYMNYLVSKKNGDQQGMHQCKNKLRGYSEEYRFAANQMGIFLNKNDTNR